MRGLGRGRGLGPINMRAKQTKQCTCPKCGYSEDSVRAIPCTEKKCPKCGTLMKGDLCL